MKLIWWVLTKLGWSRKTYTSWPWSTPSPWQRFRSCFDEGRAGAQPDAADFNLAVTLVAPWEEYVLDLSPDFKMKNGDEALERVIPDTGNIEDKILSTWGASLKANVDVGALLPGSKTDTTEHDHDHDHDGAEASEPEKAHDDHGKNKAHEQGDHKRAAAKKRAPTRKSPAGAGKSAHGGAQMTPHAAAHHDEDAGAARSPDTPSRKASGKDPMLEYAAATALYQEVKLLNRYVADAALRRDYCAYVVRLQMSVVPFARHFPLDIYSNISFFPVKQPKSMASKGVRPKRFPAEVIPLLVTDNLENTIKSRTVDSLRNLALTLSFLQPGVQGSAGFSGKHEDFKRALGGDLNSLLTVGRVSDNTLQVRLGAEREVASALEYAVLPRTHNITVLLLVPAEFAENDDQNFTARIMAVSKTQLRDAGKGIQLPPQVQDIRLKHVEELISDGQWLSGRPNGSIDAPRRRRNQSQSAESKRKQQEARTLADRLLRHVFNNEVDGFEQDLTNARFERILVSNELESHWDDVCQGVYGAKEARKHFKTISDKLGIHPLTCRELDTELQKTIRQYALFERTFIEERGHGEAATDAQSLWSAILKDTAVMEHVKLGHTQLETEVTIGNLEAEIVARFREQVEYVELPATIAHRQVFADLSESVAKELWVAVGHFARFEEILKNEVGRSNYALDLWCDIVETFGKNEFAAVRFELPPRARLPEDTSVLAVDDGEHTVVRLQGGSGLNQNGVTATLRLKMTDDNDVPLVPIAATDVNILAGGHGMTLTFPSLDAWGLMGANGTSREQTGCTRLGGELYLSYAQGRKWSTARPDDKASMARPDDQRSSTGSSNEKLYPTVFYLKIKSTTPAKTHSPRGASQSPPEGSA
jgi:hypothetical protein